MGAEHGVAKNRKTWLQLKQEEEARLGISEQPYCLIVGGGQGGEVGEGELEVHRMVVGAVEDRDLPRGPSRGDEVGDPLHHEPGLVGNRRQVRHHRWRAGGRPVGAQALLVEGDRVKVRRIAQNLLLNALKYTRSGGVTLTWADGTTSGFGLEELRQHCPCAECRTRRDRDLPVSPLPSSPQPLQRPACSGRERLRGA